MLMRTRNDVEGVMSRSRHVLGAFVAIGVASASLFVPAGAGAANPIEIKVKANAKSLTVTIQSQREGRTTITGPGLKKTVKELTAGTYKVVVPYTKTGEAERREGKTITVTVILKKQGANVVSATARVRL